MLAAIEIELVIDDQPQAAAFRLVIETRGVVCQFDVLRQDRQLRAFEVVVRRDHFLRAGLGAGAQRHALFQHGLPGVAGGRRDFTVTGIGKFQKGHAVVLRQHDQGFAEQLLVQVHTHRQRHIKKMVGKPCGQALGLRNQAAGGGSARSGGRCQGTRTHQQRKRCRDRRHRKHERNTRNARAKNENQVGRPRRKNQPTCKSYKGCPYVAGTYGFQGVGNTASNTTGITAV